MKDFTHPFHLFLWLLLLGVLHASSAQATGWLSTSGNHIVNPDASVWVGRGANLHDTRSCGGGTLGDGTPINDNATGVAEVKRRIDVLTDTWKATFIRLALETDGAAGAGYSYVEDAAYRNNIIEIVNYIGTKPGVYVLVGIWQDPSLDANGWPTAATNTILAQLATDFYASPHVLYGVSNEPQSNFDGAQDATVWTRMNNAVAAIRAAENALGDANHHIVTVQGTRDWARDLSYYVTHPITAGGGANVAYETHVYNSPADFASLLLVGPPSRTIPVIVGEFGPINDAWHTATVNDMQTLIDLATANNIPYLAWTFHQYCPPNLIADTPGKTWYANSTPLDWHGMPIYPTDFGQLLKDNLLAEAPGADIKLSNGVALNTAMTAAVSKGSWEYYYIDLPSGSKNLVVDLYNLSANLDLYVQQGSKPIESTYDCRSILGLTSNDQCSFSSPSSGRWWIGVNNYATGTISYTVKARWSGGAGLPWQLLLLGN